MIRQAGITITDEEADSIEVVDFGLSNLAREGVQVLTLVQTERISVKVLAMFPNQTEPEHWHPPVDDDPGKEETIRVIAGTVYFHVAGEDNLKEGFIVEGKDDCYIMRKEFESGIRNRSISDDKIIGFGDLDKLECNGRI